MATVSMTLGPVIDTRTISSEHLTRFLVALHAKYDPIAGETVPTDQQVAAKWVDEILDSIPKITKEHEAKVAAKDAATAVDEIELT